VGSRIARDDSRHALSACSGLHDVKVDDTKAAMAGRARA
jgi:hypothetical protein